MTVLHRPLFLKSPSHVHGQRVGRDPETAGAKDQRCWWRLGQSLAPHCIHQRLCPKSSASHTCQNRFTCTWGALIYVSGSCPGFSAPISLPQQSTQPLMTSLSLCRGHRAPGHRLGWDLGCWGQTVREKAVRARKLLEHVCTGMVHMGFCRCVHTGGFVVPWLTFRCRRGVRGGEFTGLTSPILSCSAQVRTGWRVRRRAR